jgi:hypothetical protein
MDFMTDLPISKGCSSMVVLTDRLSKEVIADGLPEITAESVADWFCKEAGVPLSLYTVKLCFAVLSCVYVAYGTPMWEASNMGQ